MEKKYFEAPYLKIVEVKNNIIATSGNLENGDPYTSGNYEAGTQGRRGMWDDGFSEEDIY